VKAALVAAALAACTALLACAAPGRPQVDATNRGHAAASHHVLVMLRMAPQHFRAGPAYDGSYPADSNRPALRRAAQEVAREHELRIVDDWPMPAIGIDCFVMEHDAGLPDERVLAALARDPRIEWAQPLNLFHTLDGGDPLYPVQPDGKYWHVAELHRISTGRGVHIAVVDSGIDASHPDLVGQVESRENFVEKGPVPAEPHGTAIAGIVAARAGNGLGIAGVAPDARLMSLRACWQAPHQGARCNSFTLGKALDFAIGHRARVINLSLAGPHDRLLQSLLETAVARGATVVGAVDPALPGGGFPASSPAVLAVAPREAAPLLLHTHWLLAPDTDIPTCLPAARWGFVSGSSYGAAHVTGLVALLAQLRPRASPDQLKSDIVTSHNIATLTQSANRGVRAGAAGSIDACATISRAAGTCICSCPSTGALKVSHTR
jgi:subtilisin family serine protease